MSFFKNLFGVKTDDNYLKDRELGVKLGRYTDAFKSKDQVDMWQAAIKSFEEKSYLESYDTFLKYLKDPKTENISFQKEGEVTNFQFFQGSKKIAGSITKETVKAEAAVVKMPSKNVAVMRKLMDLNYSLRYSRYALKDDVIYIKFDSSSLDGSPEKLYFGLKELAGQADKNDDLLLSEFSSLVAVNDGHVSDLPEAEKTLKREFFKQQVSETLEDIKDLDPAKFEGGISYMLLNTVFKLDYLVSPEGKIMDDLEKMQAHYYAPTQESTQDRNAEMKKKLEELKSFSDSDIDKELYNTVSTFGSANPAPHAAVVDSINAALGNAKWYKENDKIEIAYKIYEYPASYGLFYFGLPHPTRFNYELLIEIFNQNFYKQLGYSADLYSTSESKINKDAIKAKISHINEMTKEQFPKAQIKTSKLKFGNLAEFAESYLTEIRDLDYSEQ